MFDAAIYKMEHNYHAKAFHYPRRIFSTKLRSKRGKLFQPKKKICSINSNFFKKSDSKIGETLSNSIGLPGVKIIFNKNANIFRRLIWFIILGCCFGLCCYQVGDRLFLYLRNPIAMHVRISRNQTVKFPSFTLCPYDIDSMAAIRRVQVKYSEISKGKTVENVWNVMDYANLTAADIWELNSVTEENTHVTFVMKKTLPIDVHPVITKNPRKFAFLGICLTVSVVGMVNFMGPAFVMRIEQNVSHDVSYHENAAFTIYPHEDNTPALHHAFFKGQIIQRGQMTTMALTVSTFNFLNSSRNPCRDAVTATVCWTKCLEKILTSRTTCRLPFMTSKARNCTSAYESGITYNATLDMYLTTKREDCICPSVCVALDYEMNVDIQERLGNVTIVEIYFQQNKFLIITEYYAYSFVSFVCDVGGNLGFYLGFCLLSLVEIVENLVQNMQLSNIRKSN